MLAEQRPEEISVLMKEGAALMNLSYNAQGDQILRVSPGTMTYNIGSTIYYINAVNNTLNIHSK